MDGFKSVGITGADGFIGKEFSKYLYHKNINLILFSKEEIIKDTKVRYIKKDLNKCTFKDFRGIDVLFHLAGTSVNEDSLNKNFKLTEITLKNSVQAGVKKFFLASSYSVYGPRNNPANPRDELMPLDEYSLSKVLSEYLLKKEILNSSIGGSIIRICSIYGEGGKGLINILRDKIRKKEKIKIEGEFERQYLYVKDLCKIFYSILLKDKCNLIYNISGERTTTKEIYSFLKNKGIDVNFINNKKASYLCRGIEIDKQMNVKKFLIS